MTTNTLSIDKTASGPAIQYDADTKSLSITGRCLEHSSWWIPIHTDIQKLAANNLLETISLQLEYMNTVGTKNIFDILTTDTRSLPKGALQVEWKYEDDDEDMLLVGECFQDMTKSHTHIKHRENQSVAA